jgi:glycosyltransferase involved in cell wall biosynthesis
MNGKSLRILIIAPYPVYPAWSGGKIRIVSLARALAGQGAKVTVLTPYYTRQRSAMPNNEPFQLRQFPYPFLMPALLTEKPFPYSYLSSFHPGLSMLIKHRFRHYDIIHIEQIQLAQLLSSMPKGIPIVHGSQNVEYDYVRHECRANWVWKIVRKRIRSLEARLICESDHTVAVSAGDRDRLAKLYGVSAEQISIIPNGIRKPKPLGSDCSALLQRLPAAHRFPLRTLFSGSDVEHNRIAVRFLIGKLAVQRPDLGIIIHGSCGKQFQGKAVPDNVIFDSLDSGFADHAVPGTIALHPIVSGGGTNLKLINYLSHGLPVISSQFGMRGFEEFADCIMVCEPEQIATIIGRVPLPPAPDPQRLERLTWDALAIDALFIYNKLIKEMAKGHHNGVSISRA